MPRVDTQSDQRSVEQTRTLCGFAVQRMLAHCSGVSATPMSLLPAVWEISHVAQRFPNGSIKIEKRGLDVWYVWGCNLRKIADSFRFCQNSSAQTQGDLRWCAVFGNDAQISALAPEFSDLLSYENFVESRTCRSTPRGRSPSQASFDQNRTTWCP